MRMLMRIRDLPCGPRPQALQSIVDAATRGHADWNGLMVELPDVAMEAAALSHLCKAGKMHFIQALGLLPLGSPTALVLAAARALRGLTYMSVHRDVVDLSTLARLEAKELNTLARSAGNKSVYDTNHLLTSVSLLRVAAANFGALTNEVLGKSSW